MLPTPVSTHSFGRRPQKQEKEIDSPWQSSPVNIPAYQEIGDFYQGWKATLRPERWVRQSPFKVRYNDDVYGALVLLGGPIDMDLMQSAASDEAWILKLLNSEESASVGDAAMAGEMHVQQVGPKVKAGFFGKLLSGWRWGGEKPEMSIAEGGRAAGESYLKALYGIDKAPSLALTKEGEEVVRVRDAEHDVVTEVRRTSYLAEQSCGAHRVEAPPVRFVVAAGANLAMIMSQPLPAVEEVQVTQLASERQVRALLAVDGTLVDCSGIEAAGSP